MSSLFRHIKLFRSFFRFSQRLSSYNFHQLPTCSQKPTLNFTCFKGLCTQTVVGPSLGAILQNVQERMGTHRRIGRFDGDTVLKAIQNGHEISDEHANIALICFGEMMPEELPEIRSKLFEQLLKSLNKLQFKLNISHYNAVLKVYLDNRISISPVQFLEDIKTEGVIPNRVTYEMLVEHYAAAGDIDGTQQMIECVKSVMGRPHVQLFNALIEAYGKHSDLKAAEAVIPIMQEIGIEPNAGTYVKVLCIHAKNGDMTTILSELVKLKKNQIDLHHSDVLKIINALVENGHQANITQLFQHVRRTNEFNDDAINFILCQLNRNNIDLSLGILEKMHQHQTPTTENSVKGHFIIRQLIKLNRPLDDIITVCHHLEAIGMTSRAFSVLIQAVTNLKSWEEAIDVLRVLKTKSVPLTTEHFRYLFKTAAPENIFKLVRILTDEFQIKPSAHFARNEIVQNMDLSNPERAVLDLRGCNVPMYAAGLAVVFHCLRKNQIRDAANIMSQFNLTLHPQLFCSFVLRALRATDDFESYIRILRNFHDNYQQLMKEEGVSNADPKDAIGTIVRETILEFEADSRLKILNRILDGLMDQGIGISRNQVEQIETELQRSATANTEISRKLLYLSTTILKPIQIYRKKRTEKMTIAECESILTRLDGRTPFKTIHELLARHYEENNYQKYEEIINKFKQSGFRLSRENYAQLIELQINADDASKALETFAIAQKKYSFPSFCLYKNSPIKLIKLLIEADRTEEAADFLEANKRAAVTAVANNSGSYKERILLQLLSFYRKQDAPDKAVELWMKLEMVNAVPKNPEFLIQLGLYLKKMNVDVPFRIPKHERK